MSTVKIDMGYICRPLQVFLRRTGVLVSCSESSYIVEPTLIFLDRQFVQTTLARGRFLGPLPVIALIRIARLCYSLYRTSEPRLR